MERIKEEAKQLIILIGQYKKEMQWQSANRKESGHNTCLIKSCISVIYYIFLFLNCISSYAIIYFGIHSGILKSLLFHIVLLH